MRNLGIGAIAALTTVALAATPSALAQCVVGSVPNQYLSLNMGGPNSHIGLDYAEERPHCDAGGNCWYDVTSPTSPPPYSWGFWFGEGTWHYAEANGLAGLQRGGFGIISETPGCGTIPCIIFNEQIEDETCGAGPDRLIL